MLPRKHPTWSNGQDSWLSPSRPGFNSRRGNFFSEICVIFSSTKGNCKYSSNTIEPEVQCVTNREYLMYNRGQCFLAFVCFILVPSPASLPLSRQQVVSLSQALWAEGAKSYYWRESLVLYNPMTTVLTSWSQSNNQRARISEIQYGAYKSNLHRGATIGIAICCSILGIPTQFIHSFRTSFVKQSRNDFHNNAE